MFLQLAISLVATTWKGLSAQRNWLRSWEWILNRKRLHTWSSFETKADWQITREEELQQSAFLLGHCCALWKTWKWKWQFFVHQLIFIVADHFQDSFSQPLWAIQTCVCHQMYAFVTKETLSWKQRIQLHETWVVYVGTQKKTNGEKRKNESLGDVFIHLESTFPESLGTPCFMHKATGLLVAAGRVKLSSNEVSFLGLGSLMGSDKTENTTLSSCPCSGFCKELFLRHGLFPIAAVMSSPYFPVSVPPGAQSDPDSKRTFLAFLPRCLCYWFRFICNPQNTFIFLEHFCPSHESISLKTNDKLNDCCFV